MDFDNIKGNVIRGIIAFILLIVGISIQWNILIYASLVYIISDIIWTIGEVKPLVNAIFTVLLGIASAITFIITKNFTHFFWILMWIGYFKSEKLWSEIAIFDEYYNFNDNKIYHFLNHDSSLIVKFIATLFVCAFYVLLGSLSFIFTPLAFLVPIFLIYRALRIYQICRRQ